MKDPLCKQSDGLKCSPSSPNIILYEFQSNKSILSCISGYRVVPHSYLAESRASLFINRQIYCQESLKAYSGLMLYVLIFLPQSNLSSKNMSVRHNSVPKLFRLSQKLSDGLSVPSPSILSHLKICLSITSFTILSQYFSVRHTSN